LHSRDHNLSADGRIVLRVDAIGKLSRDGLRPGGDVLRDILGNDCYEQTILLSLQKCRYVDSSGVEWLLHCHRRCEQEGGRFIVHSAAASVLQLLKMMRMYKILHLTPDLQAAEIAVSVQKEEAHEHST
jgi:anti-anti-sigma factor